MFGVVLKRLQKYLEGTVQYSTVLQCKIASHACHIAMCNGVLAEVIQGTAWGGL
jgi:hypothetical protein